MGIQGLRRLGGWLLCILRVDALLHALAGAGIGSRLCAVELVIFRMQRIKAKKEHLRQKASRFLFGALGFFV